MTRKTADMTLKHRAPKKLEIVSFRVPEELLRAVERKTTREMRSVSDYIRLLIYADLGLGTHDETVSDAERQQ